MAIGYFLHGLLSHKNRRFPTPKKSAPPLGGDFYSFKCLCLPLGGRFLVFFLKFFCENIRRRSVRVLKFHRGFILTKKGDINPQTNLETPLAPWGAFLGFLKFFFENFKSCPLTSKGLGEMF